jgi:hypothetical protein
VIADCRPCTTPEGCSDNNACTTDACLEGCTPCTGPEECNDRNGCTTDGCEEGVCRNDAIGDCRSCETPADCNDDNACTSESCDEGRCGYTPVVDCEQPPVESCNDCTDNDGDGLADYEDPDCCAEQQTMVFKRIKVKKATAKGGRRLRVKSVYSASTPNGFDPQSQDTTIQLSDRRGQLFCKTIEASHWMKVSKRMVKFWDMQHAYAGGLSDGRFTFKKNGTLMFHTLGSKKLQLRSLDGDTLKVTVRVGNRCSHASAALRSRTKALVYP